MVFQLGIGDHSVPTALAECDFVVHVVHGDVLIGTADEIHPFPAIRTLPASSSLGKIALTKKPSDLTMMAKNNNGTFPFWAAYEIVDGRSGVGAHGTREMPVWGKEFYQSSRGGSPGISTETIVRGQIMELLIYLRSMQQ